MRVLGDNIYAIVLVIALVITLIDVAHTAWHQRRTRQGNPLMAIERKLNVGYMLKEV